MSGAYKYRPQYTQNTIGPTPERRSERKIFHIVRTGWSMNTAVGEVVGEIRCDSVVVEPGGEIWLWTNGEPVGIFRLPNDEYILREHKAAANSEGQPVDP